MAYWPEERAAELERLAEGGYSSGLIADRLGLTIGQVVGKGRRMGLSFGGVYCRPHRGVRVAAEVAPEVRERLCVAARGRGVPPARLVAEIITAAMERGDVP